MLNLQPIGQIWPVGLPKGQEMWWWWGVVLVNTAITSCCQNLEPRMASWSQTMTLSQHGQVATPPSLCSARLGPVHALFLPWGTPPSTCKGLALFLLPCRGVGLCLLPLWSWFRAVLGPEQAPFLTCLDQVWAALPHSVQLDAALLYLP